MRKSLVFLTILLLFLTLVSGCSDTAKTTDTENTEDIAQDNTQDLASYIRQDINTAAQEIGGLHVTEDKPENITYKNDTDTLELRGRKNADGTIAVDEIKISGPCDYNILGIRRGMEASEALKILEENCQNVEDNNSVVKGIIPLEQSDGENELTYEVDTSNNSVDMVRYEYF